MIALAAAAAYLICTDPAGFTLEMNGSTKTPPLVKDYNHIYGAGDQSHTTTVVSDSGGFVFHGDWTCRYGKHSEPVAVYVAPDARGSRVYSDVPGPRLKGAKK